eukprot:1472248-Rhodomonas_salina.1
MSGADAYGIQRARGEDGRATALCGTEIACDGPVGGHGGGVVLARWEVRPAINLSARCTILRTDTHNGAMWFPGTDTAHRSTSRPVLTRRLLYQGAAPVPLQALQGTVQPCERCA